MSMDPDTSDETSVDGYDLHAELTGSAYVSCPYCGESIELLLDPPGGAAQAYVEDGEGCCRPWSVRVIVEVHGQPTVSVSALDEV